MLEEGKITGRQVLLLLIMNRLVIAFTYVPAINSPPQNQDVWIAIALSLPLTILFSIPALLLALRFPRLSPIQYSRTLLGKSGIFVGLLYIWFFLHTGAIALRQFGEFMATVPMPETPLLVFILGIAVIAVSAARNGLEVMGRMADMITPLAIGTILLVVMLVAKEADLKVLTPVLEKGIAPVLYGAFTISTLPVDNMMIISMVLPYLNKPRGVSRVVIGAFVINTVLFVIITVSIITVFGVAQAQTRTFPTLGLMRLVNLGGIIERIEMLHMGIWVLGNMIKVSIFCYLAVLGLGHLFRLQTYRPIVLPVGALMTALSIWLFDSLVDLSEFTSYKVAPYYALFFNTVIPLILLVIAFVTGKRGERR
ncbi:GerAB/ArcD/ProY family transporter [Candidatus Formimonas warabiya]|nr:endospore germination permease [Candidatus Formimonas warabiya]